jgi:hypothetical protein
MIRVRHGDRAWVFDYNKRYAMVKGENLWIYDSSTNKPVLCVNRNWNYFVTEE